MSVFAELLQTVAYAVTDLIVMLTALASKPLRFILVFLGVATISSMRRDPATAEAEYQRLEAKFNRWFYRAWEKLRETR
jgi:hypothetical protein